MFVEWRLTEARLLLSKGDYIGAEKILRGIDRNLIDSDQMLSIDILEAETLLMRRMPIEAIKAISSERWVSSPKGKTSYSLKLNVYKTWIEGVALAEIGELKRSRETLEFAEIISKKGFGESHPNTSKIILAKAYAAIREGQFEKVKAGSHDVKKAVENLTRKFPSGSKAVVDAEKLAKIITNPGNKGSLDLRSELARGVPFL